MATYCVVKSLNTEWVITSALDQQQCLQQGGVIEERANPVGCGSQSIATNSLQGLSGAGIQGETAALVLMPLRMFRTTYGHSPVVAQLEHLSGLVAGEIDGIFARDEAMAVKVRNAFFRASFLISSLIGQTDDALAHIHFTKELHEGLAEVAREMARYTKDPKIREALEEMEKTAHKFVGKNFREIKAVLREPSTSA